MLVNISDAMLGTESIYLEVGVEITQRKMKVDCFLVAPSLPVHGVMPMKVDGNQTLLQDIITGGFNLIKFHNLNCITL